MQDQSTEKKVWYINNGVVGLDFRDLPRCTAIAKTTGERCKRAAMKGSELCGIHAGLYTPGAPEGNTRAMTHGYYSSESIKERDEFREFMENFFK